MRPDRWRNIARLAVCVLAGLVGAWLLRRLTDQLGHLGWFRPGCLVVGLVAIVIGAVWWCRREVKRTPHARAVLATCIGVVVIASAFAFPGPDHSSIWAGYVTTRPVTSISASWTQPRVTSKVLGWSAVSFWAGLQGLHSHAVEQIGVEGRCMDGGAADYQPWYEDYPRPPVDIGEARFLVSPGDRIVSSVASLGRNRFRLELEDVTTQARFVTIQTAKGVGVTDGGVLVEVPSKDWKPAWFAPVSFTAHADGLALGVFSPIVSEMVTRRGATETTTSALAANGTIFTVVCHR